MCTQSHWYNTRTVHSVINRSPSHLVEEVNNIYIYKQFISVQCTYSQGGKTCGRQPARKWRASETLERKWRENEEMERERENGERFPHFLSILSSSLHYHFLYISSPFSHSLATQFTAFVATVAKILAYAIWEIILVQNRLRESPTICASLHHHHYIFNSGFCQEIAGAAWCISKCHRQAFMIIYYIRLSS